MSKKVFANVNRELVACDACYDYSRLTKKNEFKNKYGDSYHICSDCLKLIKEKAWPEPRRLPFWFK